MRAGQNWERSIVNQSILSLILILFLETSMFSNPIGAKFLLTDVGARPSAMGGAFGAMRGDLNLINWNPAGIYTLSAWQIAYTHVSLYQDNSCEWLCAGGPISPLSGIAVSLFYSGDNNFVHVDSAGNDLGRVDSYNLVGSVAYARKIIKGLSVGINVKSLYSKLFIYPSYGYAMDFGLLYLLPIKDAYAGLALENVGQQSAYIFQADPLPTNLKFSLSKGILMMKDDALILNAEAEMFTASGEKVRLMAGAEYSWHDQFFIRGGYTGLDSAMAAMGFGARISGYEFDYAYVPYNIIGQAHRFSLAYEF